MRYVYFALVLGLIASLFMFKVQNLDTVTVTFFSLSMSMPLSLLLLLVYFFGMTTGGVVVSMVRSWVRQASMKPQRPTAGNGPR